MKHSKKFAICDVFNTKYLVNNNNNGVAVDVDFFHYNLDFSRVHNSKQDNTQCRGESEQKSHKNCY